jgi:hypothetical protein
MLINSSSADATSGISGAKLQVLGGIIAGIDGLGSGGTGYIAFNSAMASAPTTAHPIIYHRQSVGLGIQSDYAISFAINGSTEAMRLDASGNLGLGVTPSAWGLMKALQVTGGPALAGLDNNTYLGANWYFDGANSKYIATDFATLYTQSDGAHKWERAASGTAGNAISFTTAMTLDASSNLAVTGSISSNSALVSKVGTADGQVNLGSDNNTYVYSASTDLRLWTRNARPVTIYTNDVERINIGAGGAVTIANTAAENTQIFTISKSGTPTIAAYLVSVGGWNGAASGVNMGRNSSTSRSISAGGSINANGADYAEYMTKAGDFTIAKGDVAGIDANGKLTNVFANAVSFVVKSTDPSYVGGDSWGNEETLGVTFPKQPVRAEDDTDETFADKEAQYTADKANVDEVLEAARQLVDRIAFAGQVPVNVLGATAGQYIIPVNDNGAIKGEAVSSPTFEQYQAAVGKVIAIESDGRARIIVKVA